MIPPFVFPNYRQADMLPAMLIAKGNKPYSFLELAMLLVFRSSILCFIVGIQVATTASLSIAKTAIAQIPSPPNHMPLGEKTISQVNVLFVNPSVGDDKVGNGGEQAPWKTITQALQVAKPNTVIMLCNGTYSAETGEVFPLMLKPGVSIQGDSQKLGRGIEIQGGGEYLSRSYGGQNTTIVGANQAILTGVTVTNRNRRGYGLWIESSNPIIKENTFTGSTQDGISINGNSAPIISKNYFYRNGANGITIAGNSRAQVQENVFEQTGFGINIAQNASPIVVGNKIQNNRAGIVVQANARPIFRNNLIEGSKEDGLVAIAQAIPDLGNASEPGGNQFRNNARYDINALAAKQVISANGNILAFKRIAGKVDMQATTASIASLPNNTALATPAGGEVTFSAPISQTGKLRAPLPSHSIARNNQNNIPSGRLNPQLLPLQPANSPLPVVSANQQQPTSRAAIFPTPSRKPGYRGSVSAPPSIATTADPPQMNYVRTDPNTIEFTAPQSASPPLQTAKSQGQSLPILEAASVSESAILEVSDRPNPIGNTRNLPKVPAPESEPTKRSGASQSPLSMGVTQRSLRYRVMVEIANQKDQELVRFLAPGALATVWQGRGVMQAGVFSSRYNAEGMVKLLKTKGLKAMVEPTN